MQSCSIKKSKLRLRKDKTTIKAEDKSVFRTYRNSAATIFKTAYGKTPARIHKMQFLARIRNIVYSPTPNNLAQIQANHMNMTFYTHHG